MLFVYLVVRSFFRNNDLMISLSTRRCSSVSLGFIAVFVCPLTTSRSSTFPCFSSLPSSHLLLLFFLFMPFAELLVRGHLWSSFSLVCGTPHFLKYCFYRADDFYFLEQLIHFFTVFHFFLFNGFVTIYIMFKLFASLSVEPTLSVLSF